MHYSRPNSVAEAVNLLGGNTGNAFILAGGSDLLVRMKGGFVEPSLIVDIKAIAELRQIRATDKGFWIGAAVTCAELGESEMLRAAWPGVVEAANLIGSKQVQGRCTIAGNLCNASPAADSVPALVAAGARVHIVGPNGSRVTAVEDVPLSPGKTSLAPGEMVAAIELDERPAHASDAYIRFIPRTEMDIAVASAGINLTLDADGTIKTARVALGAVAPTVLRVDEAAEALVGTKLETAALERLAETCSAAARPIDDKRGTIAYRKSVVGVLAKRTAELAYKRARANS